MLCEQQSRHLSVRYFKTSHETFEKSHLIRILNGIPNSLTTGFGKPGIILLLKAFQILSRRALGNAV